MSGKWARRYLRRQHVLDLVPAAIAFLTELTHRRTSRSIEGIKRLPELLQTYGNAALCAAFTRGLTEHAIDAEYVAHFLDATRPALPFDPPNRLPMIGALPRPRAGRVQGASRQRPRTRASTIASPRRVERRSEIWTPSSIACTSPTPAACGATSSSARSRRPRVVGTCWSCWSQGRPTIGSRLVWSACRVWRTCRFSRPSMLQLPVSEVLAAGHARRGPRARPRHRGPLADLHPEAWPREDASGGRHRA